MAVTQLWLVRHGESVGNEAATRADLEGLDIIPLDIRDADVPLSDTGQDQADALGTWLAEHRSAIDVFWVSPYMRARQTLAIALGDSQSPAAVAVDERLRDRELGILDLLTRRGVARLHPEEAERRRHLGKFYHRPPGGESWADVALRLRSFLSDALAGPGESALVVAHDAIVMLFLYLLLPMEEEQLLEFAASHTVLNASVTHLVRTDAGWELAEFSEVGHLQREGARVTVHPGNPDVQPD
jgi:probable phosphoglycerate mutase